MEAIDRNLWVLRFPLPVMGAQMGRTVTVMRLPGDRLAIHSTGPFTDLDVATIQQLGEPSWLAEATLLHDTFAAKGRRAFPELPYFGPGGFEQFAGRQWCNLASPPSEWSGHLEVMQLEGMPKVREHVFLHRATRTLLIADLVFNFGPAVTAWTRMLMRWGSGIREFPGMSRLFRMGIRDRAAFAGSVKRMLSWDFDRVICGHGDIIESDGKSRLTKALARAGF